MKKFILLSGATVLCAISMAANITKPLFVKISNRPVSEAVAKSRTVLAKTAQPQLWRATKISRAYWNITDWDTMTGNWGEPNTTTYTYNNAGQITSESDIYNKTEYEYDADGRCIRIIRYYGIDGPVVPIERTEFTYDTIVKNFVTEEKQYQYDNNKWELTNDYRTVITRNADNNITQIKGQWYSPYSGIQEWQNESLVEIGYGSDKKANTIKIYYYEDQQPMPEAEIVDIVWDRTDGQIVDIDTDDAEFFLGANRIKSAKGVAAYTYPYAGDIYCNVEYKPENAGFKMTATMNGVLYSYTDYTVLDANGSYTNEEFETDYDYDYDYDDDTDTYVPDDPQLEVETKIYDAYGIVLKESYLSYIDGDKANGIGYQNETTADVTYDATYGYPLEYTVRNSYDGATPENREHVVFSDYYDVIAAGVTDVEVDENAPVEYYNLQGVRVANPTTGLYIRRQGNSVSKVVFK